MLRLLSLAASDPASERFARADDEEFLRERAPPRYLAEASEAIPDELAPGEVAPTELDLAPLARGPACVARQSGRGPRSRVRPGRVSKECPPYEVQYCPQTFSIYRSQRMADIAGFYRAFGVEPGRDAPERPDHIACELEFLAWLVAKERHALAQEGDLWIDRARTCRDAQRNFVAEHLAWWVPAFAHALGDRARSLEPRSLLHEALAKALSAFVPVERALLGIDPPDELACPQSDEEKSGDDCAGCSSESGPS